jgi:4-hydroxyphenylacetate 3-monooxygenase
VLDRFLRGSNSYDPVDRVKTLKVVWEIVDSEFDDQNELYERNCTDSEERPASARSAWPPHRPG